MSRTKETSFVCPDAVKVANILLNAAQRARTKGNGEQARIFARMAHDHIEWDKAYHSSEAEQPLTNH